MNRVGKNLNLIIIMKTLKRLIAQITHRRPLMVISDDNPWNENGLSNWSCGKVDDC